MDIGSDCWGLILDYKKSAEHYEKFRHCLEKIRKPRIIPIFEDDGSITYNLPRTGILDVERFLYELGAELS
jgi:hypothetical protein